MSLNVHNVKRGVTNKVGSDSSGGAGIEADLKTFTTHGCYGMTCITGLTAQNTLGVKQIYPIESQEMIENCLDAVFSDIGVDSIKTGMLTSVDTIETVTRKLKSVRGNASLVVDPVMIATSGSALIGEEAIDIYLEKLFPVATVITPNLMEAKVAIERVSGEKVTVSNLDDLKNLAKDIVEKTGCSAALVKGGHAPMDEQYQVSRENPTKTVDVLYHAGEFSVFENKYINSDNTHGTGCTLASSIASNLAKGQALKAAVENSILYVNQAISSTIKLGTGNGPVNHLHNISIRPFTKGRFLDYLKAHPKVAPLWKKYVDHPFTVQLARKELPLDAFKFFLKQDYLYLVQYSRAQSLAGFKSEDIEDVSRSAQIVAHIKHEMQLHLSYCKEFGITLDEINNTKESTVCTAYSRFILDTGSKQDWLGLQVALSPCLFGYLEAADRRSKDPQSISQNNPYWRWVENYLADDYVAASTTGRELLETHIMSVSPERLEQLVTIFAQAAEFECRFWDSALRDYL